MHAEFYYGFVCTAFAWQIVYLMISRDPLRLRPMLIPVIMAKAGFEISVYILFAQGRLAAWNLLLPSIDLVLAALFAWAYVALRSETPRSNRPNRATTRTELLSACRTWESLDNNSILPKDSQPQVPQPT